jgi:hypothetical protein
MALTFTLELDLDALKARTYEDLAVLLLKVSNVLAAEFGGNYRLCPIDMGDGPVRWRIGERKGE